MARNMRTVENKAAAAEYQKNVKKKKRSGRIGMAIVFVFLLVVMSVQVANLYEKRAEYQKVEAAKEAELEEQKKRQEDLAEYEEYTKSDDYVEDTAKEKLGLIYENEIIFRER